MKNNQSMQQTTNQAWESGQKSTTYEKHIAAFVVFPIKANRTGPNSSGSTGISTKAANPFRNKILYFSFCNFATI